MFAIIAANVEQSNESMQCILSLYDIDVCVLFDTGSTHSFIAPHVMSFIPVDGTLLPYYLSVVTPGGVALLAGEVLRDCDIKVCDK